MYKVNSVKGTGDYRTSAVANFLRKNANIHPVRQDLLDEYVPVILEHLETLEKIKPTHLPTVPAYTRVEALPNTSVAYQFSRYESFEKIRSDAKRGLASSPLYRGIDKFSVQDLAEGRFKGVNGDDNRLQHVFSILVNYTQAMSMSLSDIIENGYSKYNINKFMKSYEAIAGLFDSNGAYATIAGENRSNSLLHELEDFGLSGFYKSCEKFLKEKSVWQSRIDKGKEIKPYIEKEVISIIDEEGQKDEQMLNMLVELYQESTSSLNWVMSAIQSGEMRASSDEDAEKTLGVSIFDLNRISDNLLKFINNGYLNKDDYMELIDLMRGTAEEIQTGYRDLGEAGPAGDTSGSEMDWTILFTGTDVEKDAYLKSIGFESGLRRVEGQYKGINNFFNTVIMKFYNWKKSQIEIATQKDRADGEEAIDSQDFYEFISEFYNLEPSGDSSREWIQSIYDRETMDAANSIVTEMIKLDQQETDNKFYMQDDFKKLESRVKDPIQSYASEIILKDPNSKDEVIQVLDRIKRNRINNAQEAMAFLDDCNEIVGYLKKPEDFDQSRDGLNTYALLQDVMNKKKTDYNYLFMTALNDLVEEIAVFDENLDDFFGKKSRYKSTRSKTNKGAKNILDPDQIMAMENYEKIRRDLSYFYDTVNILIERVNYVKTEINSMEASEEEQVNPEDFRQKYEGILRVVHSNLSYLMKFAYGDSISNIFQQGKNKSFFSKYNDVIYYINFILEYISPHADPTMDINSTIDNLNEIKTKLGDFLFYIESIITTLPEEIEEQAEEEVIEEETGEEGEVSQAEKGRYFGWGKALDFASYVAPLWKDVRANIEALYHDYLNNNMDKQSFVAEVRKNIVPLLNRMETVNIGGVAKKSLNNMVDIMGRRLLPENSEVILNNYMSA